MHVKEFFLFIISFVVFSGCSISPKAYNKESQPVSRKTASDSTPVEPAEIQGIIVGAGGESDIYFITDKKLGKIFLNHRNSSAYESIRNNLGKYVHIRGTWDESENTKLIFIVDTLELVK